ncbi:MAG: hypothetical protein WCZ28_07300 [Burkholderiaceae bacterium]
MMPAAPRVRELLDLLRLEQLDDDTFVGESRNASDYSLLGVALQPHGLSFLDRKLQAASLDHVMWFHRPVRMDDWLLYSMDSPVTAGTRAFIRGQIFSRDGQLVASTSQEGVIRTR